MFHIGIVSLGILAVIPVLRRRRRLRGRLQVYLGWLLNYRCVIVGIIRITVIGTGEFPQSQA